MNNSTHHHHKLSHSMLDNNGTTDFQQQHTMPTTNALGTSQITNNTYAMLHNTTVNVNANITTGSDATLLLTNLLQNMNEKENIQNRVATSNGLSMG